MLIYWMTPVKASVRDPHEFGLKFKYVRSEKWVYKYGSFMYGGINKIKMSISCMEITMQLHTYWLLCGGYKKKMDLFLIKSWPFSWGNEKKMRIPHCIQFPGNHGHIVF